MRWTSLPPDPAPDPGLTATFDGCLPAGRLGGPLLAFATVDSTQGVARALAAAGAPEGTVIVADYQRAGRGQGDRRWLAAPGAALLVSCVLRPSQPPSRWPGLTQLAAGAVADAVAALTPVRPRLKWPNDVLVDGRKLAGVLAQGIVGARPFVVLGIGVNVAAGPDGWPPELEGRAVSLAELGCPVSRPALLAALLGHLAGDYDRFLSGTPDLSRA